MQNSLGLAHFIQNADGVAYGILFIMAIMSFGTWYVIISKSVTSLARKRRSKIFLERFWSTNSLDEVNLILKKEGTEDPFARLVQEGLLAQENRPGDHRSLVHIGSHEDYLTRCLRRSIEDNNLHQERGLSFVATVASSAPFIGLLGTVWGIYNALIAIGLSGQGTLDKVAGPVGEALIMTGIGLLVAIPAAIAYNAFARSNRSESGRLDSFAHEVYTLLIRGATSGLQKRVLGGR